MYPMVCRQRQTRREVSPPPPLRGGGSHPSSGYPGGLPGRSDNGLQRGLPLEHIDGVARRLVRASLAPATRRTYRAAITKFRRFCERHVLCPRPAAERTVLCYVAHLYLRGASRVAVIAHLAGLRHWHVAKGMLWLGGSPRIRLALRAIAKKPCPLVAPRLPMTISRLMSFRRRLRGAQWAFSPP